MPRYAFVNGQFIQHSDAAVHIEDRGLQFADSVYEVMAVIGGHFADERGHLDRLERSLKELKIAMPVGRAALKLRLRQLVQKNRMINGGVYIQITRGSAPRDFKFPKNTLPTLIMTVKNASFDVDARMQEARSVITLPDIRWKRPDIKTTGLLAQALAKQAALDAGAFDAWMVDDDGFVTEASASNAWIIDGKNNLITRQTRGNTILKGVTRAAIQALCKKENIKIVERAFTPAEAAKAKEAFMSSAVALIVPVGKIDGKKIGDGKTGRITRQIMDIYMEYAKMPEKRQEKWTPQ